VDLVPGLYAAALAGMLAAALSRWFDAIPRRVLGGFAIALLVLLGPELFGGSILLPLDSLRGHVPFTELQPTDPHGNILQGDLIELVTPSISAAREQLLAGRWPLWNARVGAGMPLLADPQSQALQPLTIVGMPLPPLRAAAVVAALRIWTALVFFFLLVRAQGLSIGPAFLGAIAYGLSAFLLLWLGWPLANTAALLPAVLYGVVRLDSSGKPRDLALLILASMALLVAGHPETVTEAVLVAVLLFLARLRERHPGDRAKLLRQGAFAAAVSLCLAAPALGPALDYLPHTLRAHRLAEHTQPPIATAAESTDGSTIAGGRDLSRRWLPIVAPNAYGNNRYLYYWGFSNTNEDASGFVGTTALLCALLTIGARGRMRQETLAAIGALVCLAVLAEPFGSQPGALGALLGSRRILLVLVLCLAYLAACTAERFRQGSLPPLAVVAAAVVLGSILVWAYWTHRDPTGADRLAILRMGWLRWQARFLGASTLLLCLTPRRMRSVACALLGIFIASELLLAHVPANPPAPPRLAFPFTPPVGFLFSHRTEGRMAALGRAFPPNLPSYFGLSDVRIYNPAAPADYVHLLSPIITGWWGELPLLGAPENPLYARLGVRYLLVAAETRLPEPWHLVLRDSSGWVYRQPDAALLFELAPTAAPLTPSDDYEEAALTLRTHPVPASVSLATSVFQDGGWRLLADLRRTAAPAVDGLLHAELPAGSSRLDLLYRPRAFVLGCLLCALGSAAFLATVARPRRGPWLTPARTRNDPEPPAERAGGGLPAGS
jgi:hypothetical protein